MYHALTIPAIVITLYLISFFLNRNGFYSVLIHRRIWNLILAAAFLLTASGGLFTALQINYKWQISLTDKILAWHVEAGIVLVVTGLLHFLWHLSWYRSIFSGKGSPPPAVEIITSETYNIGFNLFLAGFVSSSFQYLMIREIMNIAGGFELVTGTFLASWLTASAAGAWLAGKSAMADLKKINLSFILSPLISVLMMILFSRLFLHPGETPSFLVTIIFSLIVLIPLCIISGFTFVRLINIAGKIKNYPPGKSFGIETAGGITAGIAVTAAASGLLNNYQMMLIVLITGMTGLSAISFRMKKTALIGLITASLAAAFIVFSGNPDVFFRNLLFSGVQVTSTLDTPYGNITEGLYSNDRSLYYNHRLVRYNYDTGGSEEDIHYAMLQAEKPSRVLIISGSPVSHLPELIKYPLSEIVFVERDPALLKFGSGDYGSPATRVRIINDDAFRYVRNTKERFDVVLMLLPPPSSLLLNRFYTVDFFAEIRNRLNSGGIFMCSPGVDPGYFNQESLDLYSSVYNSMAEKFKNILPVAGNKLYFIASDSPLSASICELTALKNISNTYVGSNFLSDDLITDRSEEITGLIDRATRKNTLDRPVAYFWSQTFGLSRDPDEKPLTVILLVILFALPVVAVKRSEMIMYSSSLALAGLEIIALTVLQTSAGNMYQMTGLIMAGLMAGLAAGAGSDIGPLKKLDVRYRGLLLLAFYLTGAFAFGGLTGARLSTPVIIILIMMLSFIPALLTGSIFRSLTSYKNGSSGVHSVYGADLAGSALGFILVSGLLIPLCGIKQAMWITAILIFASLVVATVGNK